MSMSVQVTTDSSNYFLHCGVTGLDEEIGSEVEGGELNGHGPVNGHDDQASIKNAGKRPHGHVPGSQPKQAMRITYEEYKMLATLLVIHCRQEEEKADSESSEGKRATPGFLSVFNWHVFG